jgi:hypothetical protein
LPIKPLTPERRAKFRAELDAALSCDLTDALNAQIQAALWFYFGGLMIREATRLPRAVTRLPSWYALDARAACQQKLRLIAAGTALPDLLPPKGEDGRLRLRFPRREGLAIRCVFSRGPTLLGRLCALSPNWPRRGPSRYGRTARSARRELRRRRGSGAPSERGQRCCTWNTSAVRDDHHRRSHVLLQAVVALDRLPLRLQPDTSTFQRWIARRANSRGTPRSSPNRQQGADDSSAVGSTRSIGAFQGPGKHPDEATAAAGITFGRSARTPTNESGVSISSR